MKDERTRPELVEGLKIGRQTALQSSIFAL
jgi:hypothetical protein